MEKENKENYSYLPGISEARLAHNKNYGYLVLTVFNLLAPMSDSEWTILWH